MSTFKQPAIAFVTGGGSGIGRATCVLLAERGVTVVVADINITAAEETVKSLSGKKHMSLQLDVTKPADVAAAIATVVNTYSSPPTFAVNCAGLMLVEPILDLSESTYDKFFGVNVKGTVFVTQAVCKELVAANSEGAIVNIASIAKDGYPFLAIYGATKAAVESFTISAAKEFGPKGIRINVLSPGFTDTPMMQVFPEQGKVEYVHKNPLGRAGKPNEIAEVIAFLLSEQSSYVNGTGLYAHGGF